MATQKKEIFMTRNYICLRGHLGKDAEIINVTDNVWVALSLAVSNDYFDSQKKEWVEKKPYWFDVRCFNDLANRTKFLKKGERICVEGKLSAHTKKDEHGNSIKDVGVIANHITYENLLKASSLGKD